MNTPLRVNEALLIAHRAFQPFQCVAWAPQDGTGDVNFSVIDRTNTRLLGRAQVAKSQFTDPAQLERLLQQSRAELNQQGYDLEPWQMSA
jgi:hypothetical protein